MIEYEEPWVFAQQDFQNQAIKPSALLYCFQQAAMHHAENAGLGFEDLIKENKIWVVLHLKYQILQPVQPGKYKIKTWPFAARSVLHERDYYLFDAAGNLAAKGTSQWCVLDEKTRKISRLSSGFLGEFHKEHAFFERFSRIPTVEGDYCQTYVISEKDLDRNLHTNNCRYANMIEGILQAPIKEFAIHFLHETRLGDALRLFLRKEEKQMVVFGKLPDGTAAFSAEIKN